MKTGLFLFITVVGLTVLYAWRTKQTGDITKAEWIMGTWENKTPRGSVYENWVKNTDSEFSGTSYTIKAKDTIVFEKIRLVQERKGLFYIPIVKNQNDGLPIRFVAKQISDSKLVFENPNHDFPQIISYTRIGSDSLVAEISGSKNGQDRKQTFPMKRIK